HVHDEIGAQRALAADEVQLLREIAVLDHAGKLYDALQREFAPAAAHLRPAQRRDEAARLALQLRLTARERLDLRAQMCEGIAPLALERLRLVLDALERLLERGDELSDRSLALLERTLREDLLLAQALARHPQEQLAVRTQRFRGER